MKVDKRTNIQFHYGEDEKWSEGCFIVGDHLVKNPNIDDLMKSYCKLENGEKAVKRIRNAVLNPSYDNSEITIYIADDDKLFPDFQPTSTKC